MSSCVYEAEQLSFSCVLDVVNDVRTGNITTETARKILKQVDSGLAQFGRPDPVGVAAMSEDELLNQIESKCVVQGTANVVVTLLPLLIKLLEIVIKR